MSVTLIWRTDVHISDEAPVSRTDDWASTCLEKLIQVGEIARAVNANAVIDGADLFHRKSPTKNSHNLVQRLMDVHQGYPCPTYGNFGNHDAKHGDIRYLDESPLGTLFKSGTIRRLYNEHEAVFTDGAIKVRVVGIPYHGTTYDLDRFRNIKKGEEDYLVCIAHVLASKDGGTMFEGEDIVGYDFLKECEPDVFAFGHWHKNQGITDLGGKWVVNTGSLTRGSLSQDDIERIPSCVQMTYTKEGIELIEHKLNVKSPFDVFNIEGKIRKQERELNMEVFVESMTKTLASDITESVEDKVRKLEINSEIREMMLDYLDKANA